MDSDSDHEIDTKEHKRLVESVLNLNTRQYVNKPSRTEPTPQISEYNLVKSISDNKDAVRLCDLTRSLKDRAGDVELRKKVKKAEVKSKTLPKPLEKPQAERIRRSTAYDNTKKQLDRWEPLVTSNRVSTNLSFPLKDPNFDYKEARDFTSDWVLKSELQKEIESLEPKVEVIEVDTEKNLPKMTLKEMIERRKEMAKLRRYQNYKEIKARRQNKIKSKKFRRIQRKEKIKEQMKEFELLQKTNPEEALKKLEEIEKVRAGERASLRHKSTGKWARNQQIRAKYDKESRKVLAEQLLISKDLMQKQELNESSESESDDGDADIVNNQQNGENPWVNRIKPTKEVEEFVSGYRKFWENKNLKNSGHLLSSNENMEAPIEDDTDDIKLDTCDVSNTQIIAKEDKDSKVETMKRKRILVESCNDKIENIKQKRKKPGKRQDKQVDSAASVWDVSPLDQENDNVIDDIFDNIEFKIKEKVNKKLDRVRCKSNESTKASRPKANKHKISNNKSKEKNEDACLLVSSKPSAPNVEITDKTPNLEDTTNKNIDSLKELLETKSIKQSKNKTDIKPDEVKEVKPVSLNSGIPDVLSYDDNEQESTRMGIIAEAFEDTDIMEEFAQDKNDTVDKDAPKDIDLTLPGWGSWGGKDIPVPKKKKRFIIKAPRQVPRKDMNKGDLIINESANDGVKSHLVSDVPFPFKTVKDFEASIRAPIGNTFVPETAFRKMIKPALVTKMGAVIEPVTEDILLHKEEKKKKKK